MTYELKESPGWCGDPKRGAAMGRGDLNASDQAAPIKFHLRRVPLDSGGYDRGGAYWGIGSPLYHARVTDHVLVGQKYDPIKAQWVDDYDVPEMFFRARNRDAAKAEVLGKYPNARFFR